LSLYKNVAAAHPTNASAILQAMWLMSNKEAAVFIAVVMIMVALAIVVMM
jgi:hypothetical protein